MNEFEPTSIELEALHLAGQLELSFAITALAGLMRDKISVPVSEIVEVQNKLLDRYVDLNMELPE